MTNIFRNDLIFSLSYALDYVEREMVMVSSHHSKRVAYLAASMGRRDRTGPTTGGITEL